MIEWVIAVGSALALGLSGSTYRDKVRRRAQPEVQRAREGLTALSALLDRPHYVRARSLRKWSKGFSLRPLPGFSLLLSRADRETLAEFRAAHAHLQERAREARARFEAAEMGRFSELFDSIENSPLTEAQRLAIVRNERANLALAGAGSGKTSTIVGKVGYLLRSGRAGPGEILVLAFAKKAQQELAERIERRVGEAVEVRTFHSLARMVVASVEGRAPELSRLSEERFLALSLGRWLRRFCQKIPFLNQLAEYFAEHIYPVPLEETSDRYQTLQGEMVRSWGEMAIANWLFLNGIPYEYERAYEHDTASVDYRQYRPDFYLTRDRIYIEYFGVDEAMKPRKGIDAGRYRRQMEWKRELHRRHGTSLVECYAFQARRGVLVSLLAGELMRLGVERRPLSPEQLRAVLQPARGSQGYTSSFLRLIGSFLRLFRANLWSYREVVERAGTRPDAARCLAFLELFRPFYRQFRRALHAEGAIDFDAMIARGTRYLRAGRYRPAFRYILVDEFQDLSRGRYRFLQELMRSPRARLFAVGDDWQSIFRFTGSDVTLMAFFDRSFPDFQRTDLDRTFRFGQELSDFSSHFITRNPIQLKKTVLSERPRTNAAAVEIRCANLEEVLEQIETQVQDQATVFLLARFRFRLPDADTLSSLQHRFPRLCLTAMTIHASKGLEADYAVVLGVVDGMHGIPARIDDDPVLGLLLQNEETFAFAEERRLFYVAVTRARRSAFLLTNRTIPSSFLTELRQDGYQGLVAGDIVGHEQHVCPDCACGTLVQRSSEYGRFFGCSQYPGCQVLLPVCPQDGCVQPLLRRKASLVCPSCSFRLEACPQCETGWLVEREGRFGRFLGCRNYRSSGPSCSYTRNLAR